MAIDVEWQDERGKTLARYEGPLLDMAFCALGQPDSVCFRFIDPYGNTTFNQWQIESFDQELRTARQKTADDKLAASLDALIEFVAQARGQTHTYIKFIGD
jgi:hypothetical protein